MTIGERKLVFSAKPRDPWEEINYPEPPVIREARFAFGGRRRVIRFVSDYTDRSQAERDREQAATDSMREQLADRRDERSHGRDPDRGTDGYYGA